MMRHMHGGKRVPARHVMGYEAGKEPTAGTSTPVAWLPAQSLVRGMAPQSGGFADAAGGDLFGL